MSDRQFYLAIINLRAAIKLKLLTLLIAVAALLQPIPTYAYGEDCLSPGAPTGKTLSSNSTYADHSWKVSVTNSCSEPLEATVSYKVVNSEGFELDDDIAFGVIIPSNSTVLVREIMLVSPASNAALISSNLVSLSSRRYEATLAEECLRVGSGSYRALDSNSTYTDISLRTEIINDCVAPFESTVYFNFYDSEGFLVDYGIETRVYSPSSGTGVARDNTLLSGDIAPLFASIVATLENQRDADTPDYLEAGKWLNTAPSIFDASTSILTTTTSVDDFGEYSLEFSLLPSMLFSLNQASIAGITSLPPSSSRLHGSDSSLRIPILGVENFAGINALENVVLKLNNASDWTFSLASYADERNPNFIDLVDGAGSCISIGNLEYKELSSNSTYSEISWKTDVSNACAQTYESTFYFHVHDSNDLVLDYDLETNLSYAGNSTRTLTGTMLISPPELVTDIAKLSAKLTIR